jgi:hypothetical protein
LGCKGLNPQSNVGRCVLARFFGQVTRKVGHGVLHEFDDLKVVHGWVPLVECQISGNRMEWRVCVIQANSMPDVFCRFFVAL